MNWKIAIMTLFLPIYLDAQSIQLTSPTTNQSFQEGDDFFKTVMNNPRDFETRRDFMWEEKFNESTIDETPNGTWTGTVASNGAYVFPLFHGFENALNLGETGANYPLDASKYTLFSSYNICSERTRKVIYWTKNQKWPDGTMKIDASKDGIYTPNTFIAHPNGDPVVDIYDLSDYTAWSNMITGIRVDPTYTSATSQVQYDWIRVSDPNSAPVLSIQWNTQNVPWNNVRGTTPAVNVFIDNNNSGYDGAFIGRTLFTDAQGNTNGQFDLYTSTLPPGEYYFYLELRNNVDSDDLLATSGYSAKVTINGKPHIEFTNPSYTTGPDYATEVIGNPWDMNDAADISNAYDPVSQTNFLNPTFTNGYFCATATNPNPGSQPHSDNKIFLNIDPNNLIKPADYRYFTYELEVDESGYGNISNKVQNGWVTRLIWMKTNLQTDGTVSFNNVTYEGRHQYTIDLHRPNAYIVDSTHNSPAQTGWLANDVLTKLRLDPLEVSSNTKYYVHDVKLTGVPKASGNNFTLAFNLSDPESGSGTVQFYYDADQSGFNGTLIGSANYTLSGNKQYTFPLSSVPNGTYFIYAKVSDGFGNEHKVYTEVPIQFQPGDCIQQNPYVLSGVIPSDAYRAISIQSNGTVMNGSNVQMFGENHVILTAGFESKSGSLFTAAISGCN